MAFLYLLDAAVLPSLFFGFLAGILIFIIPGFPYIYYAQKRKSLLEQTFYCLVISTIILIFGIIIHVLLKARIGLKSYICYLFIIINLSFVISRIFNRKGNDNSVTVSLFKGNKLLKFSVIVLLLFSAYTLLFYLSIYIIPPLQDNTVTTQSTAYGLSVYFMPKTFTDRYICYEFAHPPLMNFYTAASFFLSGYLERVKYYYDYANKFEELMNKKFREGEFMDLSISNFGNVSVKIKEIVKDKIIFDTPIPKLRPNQRLLPIEIRDNINFISDNEIIEDYIPISEMNIMTDNLKCTVIKEGQYWSMAREVYHLFYDNPYLYPSRLPNICFTLLSCFVMYHLVYFIVHSRMLAILGTIAYFTIPEMLIMCVGGSNTSITICALLFIIYFYQRKQRKALFSAGFLAGLIEQKISVILIPICISELLCNKKSFHKNNLFSFVLTGFIGGIGLYWLYGISISRSAFLQDHFYYHFVNRIFHVNDLGYGGYPDIFELWNAFIEKTNPFFVLPALISLFFILKTKNKTSFVVYPLWFICGAVAFSVVDWKSSKHLLLITPALLLSIFVFISERKSFSILWVIPVIAGIIINIIKLLYFIQTKNMHIIANRW